MLVPLHAAPHHAVAEIDALYDVYLDIIDKWGTDVSPAPAQPWVPGGRPWGGHRGVGWLTLVPCRTCCSWATSTRTAAT